MTIAAQPRRYSGRSPRRSARNIDGSWGSEPPGSIDHLDRASPLNARVVGQTKMARERRNAWTGEGPVAYQNWKAFDSQGAGEYSFECPLFSDCRFTGEESEAVSGPDQLINLVQPGLKLRNRVQR